MIRIFLAIWFVAIPVLWMYLIDWLYAAVAAYGHFMISLAVGMMLYGVFYPFDIADVISGRGRRVAIISTRALCIAFGIAIVWFAVIPLGIDVYELSKGKKPITIRATYDLPRQKKLSYQVIAVEGENEGKRYFHGFRFSRPNDRRVHTFLALEHSQIILQRLQ